MATLKVLSEVSGNVGVSKGSLHWSSASGKRDRASMRQSTGSRREVSCWFSICLQMFRMECEVAADFFFHQVWIWADSLACSPMCSEQCEFQQVFSLKDFSFLEEKVVWLFGHEEQLVFFPALTPCFKRGATTLSWRSNCRTHKCYSELYLAWRGHSGPRELWCPPLEKVARHGEHGCVSANIICRRVTSPSLSGLKVPPLSLGQYFCNLLFTVLEVKIWQCI